MSPERILIVDDGKENREFIVEYVLQPNGFEALVARDGREGMQMARQHQPDLILLDLQMPVMNGLEVIDALNAEGLEIPVILMTFHGSEEIAIEVYRKGVRDYVKKPYTVEEMYNAIERSLAEVRLRKEKDELTERLIAANASLNQRVRELNVLYNIGKSVTALLDMSTLLAHIAEAAAQLTSCEESSLFLIENEQIICKVIYRGADHQVYTVNEARPDPLAEAAIRHNQLIVPTEAELQAARRSNPSSPMAALATPLLIGGRAVGALVIKNLSDGARLFTRHDGGLLSALSDYAAIAVENATNHALISQGHSDNDIVREVLRRAVKTGILNQVLANPESHHATGARREVSLFAAELHGFHAFARKAPPEQIVKLLNEYLSLATDVILEQGGTLESILGDSLLAIFNAPVDQADYEYATLRAALLLQEAVREIHKQRGGGLAFSIGLHIGDSILGYMGAARAMNYSAVGEGVMLARYLQMQAKPGQILLSEAFGRRVVDVAELRPLGQFSLPRSNESILILELMGLKA